VTLAPGETEERVSAGTTIGVIRSDDIVGATGSGFIGPLPLPLPLPLSLRC
jgi:hypothetical protein